MLNINSFMVGAESLIYHGANRYWVFETGKHYEVVVDVMDDCCDKQIDERRFECSSVSSAVAIIEAMENGEDV